jgi:hypothetical protein
LKSCFKKSLNTKPKVATGITVAIIINNLANVLDGPFAFAFENKYHDQSDRTLKLKDSDVERIELLNLSYQNQFCLSLAKANLKAIINGTKIENDHLQTAGQTFNYNYDYIECKLILNAQDIYELKCIKTEKYITAWHDLEGDRIERRVDRVPIEFFTHLIDLTSEDGCGDEEINSWMYDEPVVIRRKGFEPSTVRNYEKYLLVFWSREYTAKRCRKYS